MINITIKDIPNGANVLIAKDNGTGVVTKDDELSLFKYEGDGTMNLSYPNDDITGVIIRVRCANEGGGFWVPLEIKTSTLANDTEITYTMVEDRFLSK